MRTSRLKGFLAGMTMAAVGMWSGGAAAEAATTVRVVSTFVQVLEGGELVNPDSGWETWATGTGKVEIGTAYGAPAGLGRAALMLDSPSLGDTAEIRANNESPGYYSGAFPWPVTATPERHIGFWLYRSGASTGSAPRVEAWVAHHGNQHSIISFDPVANGYDALDQWMYVDLTAADAVWEVRDGSVEGVAEWTWPHIVEHAAVEHQGTTYWGVFDYGVWFWQDAAQTFTAIDGVTVGDAADRVVTNFELDSHPPVLDNCKNGGWRAHPAGPFKNQGECIATIVAAG